MANTQDALDLLRSIDISLKALVRLAQPRSSAETPTPNPLAIAPRPSTPTPIGSVPALAPDRDLDSIYGNPEVRAMPRDWTGPSYKGRRYAECPPALLDLIAEMQEYFARQADTKGETTSSGKPVGPYRRQDAARARGWAARMRAGQCPTPDETPDIETSEFDGEVVF